MEPRLPDATSDLAAALGRGDVAAAGECYRDDAQLLTPVAGLVQGRTAIEEYWATGIALGLSSVAFEARRVEPLGPCQAEIGRYRLTVGTEPTASGSERGTYLVLHRKAVDGTWQRTVDVLQPDEPQGLSPQPQGVEI